MDKTREAIHALILPLAAVAIGGAIIGGSLMAHIPVAFNTDWVPGVLVGLCVLAFGVRRAIYQYRFAISPKS